MIELTFSFLLLAIGLFIDSLSVYRTLYREVNMLWLSEIVYKNDPINKNKEVESTDEILKTSKEEKELFSKIESLATEICRCTDLILTSLILLLISFFALFLESTQFWELLKNSSFNHLDYIKLIPLSIFALIIFIVLYILLPRILVVLGKNTIPPYRIMKINKNIYNHRKFLRRLYLLLLLLPLLYYLLELFHPKNFNYFDNIELKLPSILSLIPPIAFYAFLPRFLKISARMDIMNPYYNSQIDAKLFDVWYKHRCFEHKYDTFRYKLQPIRLYEILAMKYILDETTFGKKIEIPADIILRLEEMGLLPRNFSKK